MSEENKENPKSKKRQLINDLLMKPFSLGWTREVVRRVVTHNKTPNCDIYYFSPNKKKLRSLTEVKSHLTDGLSLECFSFKRQPLGLSPKLETVRDAKIRGKVTEKFKEREQVSVQLRKAVKSENSEQEVSGSKKKIAVEKSEEENPKPNAEIVENGEHAYESKSNEELGTKNDSEKDSEIKSKKANPNSKESNDNHKNINSNKKAKTKGSTAKSTKSVKVQSVKKRKTVLKKVVSAKKAKQAKVVPSKKVLKQIGKKKAASPKRKLSKTQNSNNKAGLKTIKNKSLKLKTEKKQLKSSLAKAKIDGTKEPETNHTDKKSAARDLKSIVKKNIGKYREMREKQKLGIGKSPVRNINRKRATVSRSRSEPISKNKLFYLKPLQKGWRRELVFRTNCARAGQQADVYYFHPSGKKLRSCREIAENLTHGLSIEYFTFRKEPIGCGEPSEVIRNARSHQKN